MSRRRGEFEHRTSIFEGAFRAWSHLGGLDPAELETKSAAELDPLTNPIENDPRHAVEKSRKNKKNARFLDEVEEDGDGNGDGDEQEGIDAVNSSEENGAKASSDGDADADADANSNAGSNTNNNADADTSSLKSNPPSSSKQPSPLPATIKSTKLSTYNSEYPYEPLPRMGLAHPLVQAIISPWLGPDADQEDIQLGLMTLRI